MGCWDWTYVGHIQGEWLTHCIISTVPPMLIFMIQCVRTTHISKVPIYPPPHTHTLFLGSFSPKPFLLSPLPYEATSVLSPDSNGSVFIGYCLVPYFISLYNTHEWDHMAFVFLLISLAVSWHPLVLYMSWQNARFHLFSEWSCTWFHCFFFPATEYLCYTS